ncbi:angiogenic factor with G patch and FHA domains 1-like isoform X2 [Watersipora subatra]|uniref:angiogenic factor with G patch and FHA domains 1-like isoform X2 n=1 Tax=Watersipora subatra TaxID=2589382 RepID=UPI00355AE0D8
MSDVSADDLVDAEGHHVSCQKKIVHAQKKLQKVERKLAKALSYNNELLIKLEDLKKALRKCPKDEKKSQVTVGTQTECNEQQLISSSNKDTLTTAEPLTVQPETTVEPTYEPLQEEIITDTGQTQSIAEQLRSAAELAISQSDYVYDESTGLYYDQQTGYYYNPETKLYYDSINYCYYSFNEQSHQYEFHSQADMTAYQDYYKHQAIKNDRVARKAVKQAKKEAKLAKEALKRCCQSSQVDEKVDDLVFNLSTRLRIEAERKHIQEVLWRPPCVRAVVEDSDSLSIGSLHVITIHGGTIGSATDSTIHIPEDTVKEAHCKLTYSEDNKGYYAVELGSISGTFHNSQRLAPPGESATIRLSNRDRLTVGSTKLLLHIHPGTDTCTDCEPGVIKTALKSSKRQQFEIYNSLKSKEDVERDRRTQLKSIKKKYGLEKEKYQQNSQNLNVEYEDKAEKRRQVHGLDLPGIPDAPAASVDAAIPTQNVGHKLLQKMGWQTGQSLGKSDTGIVEPIKVGLRLDASAGLGSQSNRIISMDDGNLLPKARKKAERMLKVQRRFEQTKTADIFNQSDEEEDHEKSSK